MRPLFFSAVKVSLIVPLLVGCTLATYPKTVTIKVALPPEVRGVRSGPELSAMKCFGIVVRGAAGGPSQSQLGNRSPSCLKMDGAFFGPYSPAETYAVGNEVTANLATQNQVSIDGQLYSAATATDRTPSCPPLQLNCSGAVACDTFTDRDSTTLSNHRQDIGGFWAVDGAVASSIFNNALKIYLSSATGARAAYSAGVTLGANSVTIAGKINDSQVATLGAMINPR